MKIVYSVRSFQKAASYRKAVSGQIRAVFSWNCGSNLPTYLHVSSQLSVLTAPWWNTLILWHLMICRTAYPEMASEEEQLSPIVPE